MPASSIPLLASKATNRPSGAAKSASAAQRPPPLRPTARPARYTRRCGTPSGPGAPPWRRRRFRRSPGASGAASAPRSGRRRRSGSPPMSGPDPRGGGRTLEGRIGNVGRHRIVILGGSYAGLTALSRLARRGLDAEVVLVDQRPQWSERIACTNSRSAERRGRSISPILRPPSVRASSRRGSCPSTHRPGSSGWRRFRRLDPAALRPLHPGARKPRRRSGRQCRRSPRRARRATGIPHRGASHP